MSWFRSELQAWKRLFLCLVPGLRQRRPSEQLRALALLAAIDAGGVPLNAAKVNDIARQLGLEVSIKAPMSETIARIRACAQGWN